MAITKTKIFNMALHELGVSSPIKSADSSEDTRAIILRDYYEDARDEVLKAYDWSFAERYTELTPTEDSISADARYQYAFKYPDDCICAREIFAKGGNGDRLKFKTSYDSNCDKILFANSPEVVLRYTKKICSEEKFDSEFAITLALYLAGLTGQAIVGSQQKSDSAMKRYWDKLRLSKIVNAAEIQEADENNNNYLDER